MNGVYYNRTSKAALSAFQEAQATTDPKTIILAEYTFLSQKLDFCEKADKDTLNNLAQIAFRQPFRRTGRICVIA